MIDIPASVEEILTAKEKRAKRQKELLARYPMSALISLSLNIPSAVKLSHEAVVVHEIALQCIDALLQKEAITLLWHESKRASSGAEALWVCDVDALVLKKILCHFENTHPLGRLMDIDVLNPNGDILSRKTLGMSKRKCFLCDNEAQVCARTRAHSYEALNTHLKVLVKEHAFAQSVALWCERAMLKEVELTPKPGLVDQHNSGAHDDMDIHTFYASIKAIKPFIVQFVEVGQDGATEEALNVFERLRKVGIHCEAAMFEATKGVNTHKGMIFCLALFGGALGRLYAKKLPLYSTLVQDEIKAFCATLIEKDLDRQSPQSAGGRFYSETKSTGIRGIAHSGFAIIFQKSLPFFLAQKEHESEEMALKRTLLFLMQTLDDSTLWSRGGMEGLLFTKEKAREYLHTHTSSMDEALNAFDRLMIEHHLSPGGSADLLAMTWFLAHILEDKK